MELMGADIGDWVFRGIGRGILGYSGGGFVGIDDIDMVAIGDLTADVQCDFVASG
jgi:hypothetical protein